MLARIINRIALIDCTSGKLKILRFDWPSQIDIQRELRSGQVRLNWVTAVVRGPYIYIHNTYL